MKKKMFVLSLFVLMFLLVGCGGKKKQEEPKKENTIGDTIVLQNFEVSLVNYSIRTALKASERHQTLVFVEVNVKNTSKKDQSFSSSLFDVYNPNSVKLSKITSSNYTTLITSIGKIRSGGTTNGHLIFPFEGYGEYYIEFDNKKSTELVKFTIYENQN